MENFVCVIKFYGYFMSLFASILYDLKIRFKKRFENIEFSKVKQGMQFHLQIELINI